jgi:hypothetical protein
VRSTAAPFGLASTDAHVERECALSELQRWGELEAEYLSDLTELWAKFEKVQHRRKAWRNWQRHYPRPVEPIYSSIGERIEDFHRWNEERKLYEARWMKVYSGMGLASLQIEHRAAAEKWVQTEKRIAATPVKNAHDLKAKAQIARLNPGGHIQSALTDDLLSL